MPSDLPVPAWTVVLFHLKTRAFFTRQSKAISRTSLLQLDEAAFKIPSGIVDELRCSICWLIGTRVRMSEMLFVSSGIQKLASQRWDCVLTALTALLSILLDAPGKDFTGKGRLFWCPISTLAPLRKT